MTNFLPLCALPEGRAARVTALHNEGGIRRRLLDLGLTPGTKIHCVQKAAAGDPTAYLIRGAVIALRRTDAAQIDVEALP